MDARLFTALAQAAGTYGGHTRGWGWWWLIVIAAIVVAAIAWGGNYWGTRRRTGGGPGGPTGTGPRPPRSRF